MRDPWTCPGWRTGSLRRASGPAGWASFAGGAAELRCSRGMISYAYHFVKSRVMDDSNGSVEMWIS